MKVSWIAWQRTGTLALAAAAVIGVAYWWTGAAEISDPTVKELRARLASRGIVESERQIISKRTWQQPSMAILHRMLQPRDMAPLRGSAAELSGGTAERWFLRLFSINSVLAAALALAVASTRNVGSGGRYFGAGLACFAVSVSWALVRAQDANRQMHFVVHPWLGRFGDLLDAVCWGACLAMAVEFIRRHPRPVSPHDVWDVSPNWQKKILSWPAKNRQVARDVTRFTRWLPLVFATATVAGWAMLSAQPRTTAATTGGMLTFAVVVALVVAIMASAFLVPVCFGASLRYLRVSRTLCTLEERRRTDWLYAGFTLCAIGAVLWVATVILGRWVWGAEFAQFAQVIGLAIGVPVGALILLTTFALSVFFRGAFEPALLLRKTVLVSLVALAMGVVLVALEHFAVGSVLTGFGFNVAHGINTVLAGVAVTVGLGPVRRRLEAVITRIIDRLMPATVIAEGRRTEQVVAFSDLSSYTQLSAENETAALHIAGVFHKTARLVAESNRGRIVKTIGDAVLWVFPDALSALKAVCALHEEFPRRCAREKLPALAVHSGVHAGSVVLDPAGDVYGATVNLASRLQSLAGNGEIVCSESIRAATSSPGFDFESIGEQRLKNVPMPVACFRVTAP